MVGTRRTVQKKLIIKRFADICYCKCFISLVHMQDPNGIYFNVVFDNYIYTCTSVGRSVLLGVLYGYKAVLQVLTVVLALKTRKVKIKGLDDYKYIVMATYVSTFVLLVVTVFTFTIEDQVNLYAALTSFSFFLGSTVIVMLVFVPKVVLWLLNSRLHLDCVFCLFVCFCMAAMKMISLYKDPKGKEVFSKRTDTKNEMPKHCTSDNSKVSCRKIMYNSSCCLYY